MARGGNERARARAQESRLTQGAAGFDMAVERAITTLIERVMRQRTSEQAALMERLEVLLGDRGNKEESAVRRGDLLLGLQRLPRASAAPTADEYNSLVDAYNNLIVALADLARK